MSAAAPEWVGHAAVLTGSFNPMIFQPAWLAAKGLIREQEAIDAEVSLMHSDFMAYNLEWVEVQIQRDRFLAGSRPAAETPELIRDLVIGVFRLLRHTPVQSVVIQSVAHVPLTDENAVQKVLSTFAPPQPWESLNGPRMRTITMESGRPGDTVKGLVRTTLEPSLQIEPNGIWMAVEDHYDLPNSEDETLGAGPALDVLEGHWEDALVLGREIMNSVVAKA